MMTLIELAKKLRPYIEKAAQSLDDHDALAAIELYPHWTAGTTYEAGTKVQCGGKLYRVRQTHTAQEGWEPKNAPALFERIPA